MGNTPFTNDDLTAVNDAIQALTSGKRIVRTSYNGRSVEYASLSLNDLLALQSRMRTELGISSTGTTPVQRLCISTGKGL